MTSGDLAQEEIDGTLYYRPISSEEGQSSGHRAHLLPAFDEYLVGYSDRSAVLDPAAAKSVNAGGGMPSPVIVIDGQVAGTWKRTLNKGRVEVTPAWFDRPIGDQVDLFRQVARRYAEFIGLELAA
jgi:hypothetical protein